MFFSHKKSIVGLRKVAAALIITVLAVFAWSCSNTAKAPGNIPDNEITQPLDSLMHTVFPDDNEPGAVVMVMRGDDIVFSKGYGQARLDRRLHMSDSVMLNVSSATKTYVTAGLLHLAEQGKLSLDQPLSDFFPEFNHDIFSKITISNVLTHTSGLPDKRPRNEVQWNEYVSEHPGTPFSAAPDYLLYGREDELTRFYEKLDTVLYEPGTKFDYQDAPYLLLPRVIERVTGEKFEDWMQKNVFEPAGLTEIHFAAQGDPTSNEAHGYIPAQKDSPKNAFRSRNGKWDEYDYGEAPFFLTRADNGIYTTPRDFAKWMHALYHGDVTSKVMLDSANRQYVHTKLHYIGYGLGLFVQEKPGLPKKVFHNTANGGFAIFEGAFPDDDLFYLIFTNRPDWNRLELANKVDSIFKAHHWLDISVIQ